MEITSTPSTLSTLCRVPEFGIAAKAFRVGEGGGVLREDLKDLQRVSSDGHVFDVYKRC